MDFDKETALVEAVFYLEGEPLNTEAIARITDLSKEVVAEVLTRLKERYAANDSGIELEQISGGWVITPKKELWSFLRERYGKKNEGKLSRAAMETLSIIAYSQPITRGEIEAIRGVSADNMIRLLAERSLIKEVGKKDIPGKPAQYGTTKEFLKFFRLNSIADLPKLDETESERFELAR
ncbi:SMC-Scp complex subunit ScpB [Treponema sp.]|uniref:SMC-Scp complex subunit ScpB n=1 Tax=Treponema sp. TaxID=166 RepID=UPI003FA28481